jgi:hypothetical protein
MGPNLKYSTGSSRDTIFFNMIARMTSGDFPAIRGGKPELPEVMDYVERRYNLKVPNEAINLLFLAKNAAISLFDATNDPSTRYVSYHTLESIYEFCKEKLVALGYDDSRRFVGSYMDARKALELTVDSLFTKALNEHPAAPGLSRILSLSSIELAEACLAEVEDKDSPYPQSAIAFSGWLAMRHSVPSRDMDAIAKSMMLQPIDRTWGGLMAVVSSPSTSDSTLSELADWLYDHEKGAYLTKLITRNPASSNQTREKALRNYKDKEIII